MADDRESIWSVSESERRWYSALFPVVLLISVLYYAIYVIPWHEGTVKGVGILMLSFGALGVSSAILSMVLVAGGRTMVISVEWLYDKVKERRAEREAARQAAEAARQAEMEAAKERRAEREAARQAEMKAAIEDAKQEWIEEGRRLEREEQRKREERMNGTKDE